MTYCKITFNAVLLFCVLYLCSCAGFRYSNESYDKSNQKSIGILKPISLVSTIGVKNNMVYDSALSVQTANQLFSNTAEMTGTDKGPINIEVDDSTQKIIYQEMFTLAEKLNRAKSKKQKQAVADTYIMSETVYQVFKEHPIEQLIISYHKGFTRTKSNYRSQNWKGLGVGLLTLGAYIPTPIKANSMIYTCVFDKNRKSVVFSNMSLKEIEPTNVNAFTKQICELYLNFYTAQTPQGICYHR